MRNYDDGAGALCTGSRISRPRRKMTCPACNFEFVDIVHRIVMCPECKTFFVRRTEEILEKL